MLDYIRHQKIIAVFLLVLNVVPLIGVASGKWTTDDIIYFYWAECAAIGLLALAPHLRRLVVFSIIFLVLIIIISPILVDIPDEIPPLLKDERVIFTFWVLYGISWLAYIELGKSRYWLSVRRLPPAEQFMFFLFFMTLTIFGSFAATISIYGAWDLVHYVPKAMYFFLGLMSILVPSVALGILRVIDMAGAKHLFNFLMGTYYQPVEIERIVLFLDMANSSTMAEKMGDPLKSMKLIAYFIYDASDIFRKNGGDIINYTGDGLVVIWPVHHSDKMLNALEQLRKRFMSMRSFYKKNFGVIPNFRVGVHGGKIVISQIGEEKLFLGIYGDVVNAAARLEQLNKKLGTQFLISDQAISHLSHKRLNEIEKAGVHSLRGKEEKIQVYTLRELVG
jgi:class 3 adenylate cyclase